MPAISRRELREIEAFYRLPVGQSFSKIGGACAAEHQAGQIRAARRPTICVRA